MDKASKTAYVARHEPTGLYFSRQAGLTDNPFNIMSFEDKNNAEDIVFRGILRVKDPENYKLYPMVTTKEVMVDEQSSTLSEDRKGHERSGAAG